MKHVFLALSALALLGACADGGPGEATAPYSAQTYAAPGYAGTTTAPATAPMTTPIAAPVASAKITVAQSAPSVATGRVVQVQATTVRNGASAVAALNSEIDAKARAACGGPWRELGRTREITTHNSASQYWRYTSATFTVSVACL